ncbi:MAG: ATP-dependent DNA helicase RecG [Verrucomicrobiia bacterium]
MELSFDTLHTPLIQLPFVGATRSALFEILDIFTVEDLFFTKPRRYEDRRSHATDVSNKPWEEGQWLAVPVHFKNVKVRRLRGGRSIIEVLAKTSIGMATSLQLRWFNVPYLAKQWQGQSVDLYVFGKLKQARNRWVLDMPEWEPIYHDAEKQVHMERIVPIYALTHGLSQRVYRSIIFRALKQLDSQCQEWLPMAREGKSWHENLWQLHFPENFVQAEKGRKRLAFDEFYVWQSLLALRRHKNKVALGKAIVPSSQLIPKFLSELPFTPTAAQQRVFAEISADLNREHPMNRLLQGDVGSGKTLVAILAILQAVEARFTAAFMAPTDILANQHFLTLRRLLKGMGLTIGLMTGNKKTQSGDFFKPQIWVGTHALFQEKVRLENLGLIVIDEQHKFGVEQRARLRAKGESPHVLVMTATPIPRTLGLTVYGDLDVSVIDELPKGRGKMITALRSEEALKKIWDFARAQCEQGRQVYIVYPAIEEGDEKILKTVKKQVETLQKQLAPYPVVALHGKLKPQEKELLMEEFREGEISVLVATTVIEVGVDVPNASVMIIENAERFGLAQLHQLRGRIGRGSHTSYCILVSQAKNTESWERLKILEKTQDGFKIAEADLELRGVGDVLGKRQSGVAPFRLGNLVTDWDLIRKAQAFARETVEQDPHLSNPENKELKRRIKNLLQGQRRKWVDQA